MKKYTMTGIVLVVLLLGMSTAVAYDSPTLVTYTITNTTIEPPQTTSIDVAFSEYVSAIIKIENASGNLVKELYSNSDVKNPTAKIWDGTYTDGTSVPDDTYTVNVTGVNTTTGLSVINTSETITVVTSGDTTPPTVTANMPTGTDVSVSTAISVTFSEAMNTTSAEDAFSITPDVDGSLGWDGDMMTFTPDADLAYSTTYEVTIGTGAEDLAGNPLAEDFTWNFTTGSPTATDTVTRTLPATAAPDDTIMVSLAIDFVDQAAINRLVITETVPDGWAIVDASNSGNLDTAGKITWMFITAIGGTIPEDGAVFTYNVTVPTDASGLYSFSGVYGTNVAGTGLDILGDVNVTIDGDEPPTLVTYTITNRTITPPQTTSIDVEFSENVSAIIKIENASGSLVKELYSNSDVKNPDAKIWDGTYTDGTTVPDDTYTVNVTGVNTTTGLSVINTSETITVQTSVSDIDTVTRTLQATAAPDDTIMVSLAIDFVDQAAVNRLVITETVPDGWAIVDASDSGNLATAGKITWMFITAIGGTIPEDGAVFTYNVTVPTDASGLHSFSGVYGTNVAGTNIDVLGNTDITISSAIEVCNDGIDNDGDGLVDCDDPDCTVDADGDGYYALPCGDDCNDTDAAVNPGATEVENGIDDDCDGQIDEGCGPCDFYLELDAGWNFVSVPKRIDGANDAISVFNIDLVNETCEYYNTSADSSMDIVNISVVPCQGYWVWKVNPETICINFKESTGAIPPPAQQLYAGWNMIGHIDTSDMPIDDGTGTDFGSMANIEGKFSQIWQWTGSGWESCYPSGINSMTPGQGYWIWMTEDVMMSGTP